METWDAIRARRNVRVFDARPLADADLNRILEAGRRAPSSRNWQPWDFVLVTDRTELPKLAEVWRGAAHVAAAPPRSSSSAPCSTTSSSTPGCSTTTARPR
jgi:nitroreductase